MSTHRNPDLAEPRLKLYVDELYRWNVRTNLTTATRSTVETIMLANTWEMLRVGLRPRDRSMIDFGAGGGLVGMPIAIWRPLLTVWSVESVRKKASFLSHVAATLPLEHAHVYWGRIEEFADEETAPIVDVVMSRATASAERCVTVAWPFLQPGGRVILWVHHAEETASQLLGNPPIPGIDAVEAVTEDIVKVVKGR